ncbi:MAG: methionine biosynthesis protein MetW [Alphaproteobacteria bacterium]|nr:methionine biosynthesis protein MetW [Alphaproteobacteria bacterium]
MNVVSPVARPRSVRFDLLLIADMINPGARVLDIGCGDGTLLEHLTRTRTVDGRGIELSQSDVKECVGRGLAVIQGDADQDLSDYPSGAFDYVVLSQTLQATRNPGQVLEELVRIGASAIVSFPNYGHWRVRWQLLLRGRMPVTEILAEAWHESPNIHPCTIRDFVELCGRLGITITRQIFVDRKGRSSSGGANRRLANLLAEQGLFELSRRG